MQKESLKDKMLRIQRREYLHKIEEKLNIEKPTPKPKKKKEVKEEVKEEVISIDESSNQDYFFNTEEENENE